ncbi:hypothetical protein Pth03_49960 [Planotetraspora thailandica]|uniref:Uncharacterized protein n=1 Tax=Planotetraspora thailandica TaxID=487172 RepID=A0A8J3V6X3_9ACTN|nr:hypothetical protein Pth03_49960 [Planotetraspora thailandica]
MSSRSTGHCLPGGTAEFRPQELLHGLGEAPVQGVGFVHCVAFVEEDMQPQRGNAVAGSNHGPALRRGQTIPPGIRKILAERGDRNTLPLGDPVARQSEDSKLTRPIPAQDAEVWRRHQRTHISGRPLT